MEYYKVVFYLYHAVEIGSERVLVLAAVQTKYSTYIYQLQIVNVVLTLLKCIKS